MLKLIAVCAALSCAVACPARAQADNRAELFAAQAHRLADMAEPAAGLVTCGLEAPEWARQVNAQLETKIAAIANRLWPRETSTDDDRRMHAASLWRAFSAVDQASAQGKHVTPQWCADAAPGLLPVLGKIAAGEL